jgi:hypothetical protein
MTVAMPNKQLRFSDVAIQEAKEAAAAVAAALDEHESPSTLSAAVPLPVTASLAQAPQSSDSFGGEAIDVFLRVRPLNSTEREAAAALAATAQAQLEAGGGDNPSAAVSSATAAANGTITFVNENTIEMRAPEVSLHTALLNVTSCNPRLTITPFLFLYILFTTTDITRFPSR